MRGVSCVVGRRLEEEGVDLSTCERAYTRNQACASCKWGVGIRQFAGGMHAPAESYHRMSECVHVRTQHRTFAVASASVSIIKKLCMIRKMLPMV